MFLQSNDVFENSIIIIRPPDRVNMIWQYKQRNDMLLSLLYSALSPKGKHSSPPSISRNTPRFVSAFIQNVLSHYDPDFDHPLEYRREELGVRKGEFPICVNVSKHGAVYFEHGHIIKPIRMDGV